MTIIELKDLIEDLPDNMEVRIAHQPNYPFELSIGECVVADANDDWDEDEEGDDWDEDEEGDENTQEEKNEVFYIGEGEQIGYLPQAAKRELGWR